MSSRVLSKMEMISLLPDSGVDEEAPVEEVLDDNNQRRSTRTPSTRPSSSGTSSSSIMLIRKDDLSTDSTRSQINADSPQEDAAPLPSPKLPSGDSCRGIGILVVIVYHMGYKAFMNAWVDISLFFSLSGFLITKATVESIDRQDHMDICKFWAKRISRIFPCVLLVINLIVISQKLPFRHNDGVKFQREATDLWYATIFATNYNLVYLQPDDYFDDFSSPSITRHLWTLSIEEQYYVIWPLIMWALSKLSHLFRGTSSSGMDENKKSGSPCTAFFIRSPQMKDIITFLWILDIAVMVSSYFMSWATIDAMGVTAAYYSTWCRMGDIAAGGFAYTSARLIPWIARRWYEDPTLPPISTKERIIYETMAVLVLLSITVLPLSKIAEEDMFMMYFRYLRFGLSLLVFFNVGTSIQMLHKPLPKWAIASRIMDNKILLFLGKISYGAYVIHWPFLVFFGDPKGVHRKQEVEEGLDFVHHEHMPVFQYHMQNLFIFILTLLVAYLSFFKYEIPFMVKSRVTPPRKTVTLGLLAMGFTLVNIWLLTKDLPPMMTFENDLSLDSSVTLSTRDNRFTPIAMISVSRPVAIILWESLVDMNTRPYNRQYHEVRNVLDDSISFGASNANILIQCKNKAEKRHVCDFKWWNNTYWFWLESNILCDTNSTTQINDLLYFSRKCDDIIQISEIYLSDDNNSSDLNYKEILRAKKKKEYELLFGIDKLIPGVINQNSLALLKGENKKNDTTPLRITMIGESISLRIGMYWKDYLNLDLPTLDYHPTASEFPTIRLLNNVAVGGHAAIAYWICKTRLAFRYNFCNDLFEKNDMIQQEIYNLETTKADVITIHDMYWAVRTDKVPTSFDRILAFNILAADAIGNGASSIYYLTQSPSLLGNENRAYDLYFQELNYFMEMVDTISCDTTTSNESIGIKVSVLDWAKLICPTVETPGKICKKYGVHNFDDILPDRKHPYGDSGLWLSREALAVVLANYGLQNNYYATFDEALKNPLSEQLLTLAPSDGDPELKDLVTTYMICPYEDLSQLEKDITNKKYSLYSSYSDSEYAIIV